MPPTRFLVPTLLALAMHAAASQAANPKIDEAALAEMRKGRTTFQEVVGRYGRPNFTSTNWDGAKTAAYAYGDAWSPATLSALGAALGSSGGDTVVLYFDGKGLLTDYKINQAAARPADAPATPTVRYVEPSFGGTKPAPVAKPAAAATEPVEATPLASPSAARPAATQAVKPQQRSDGLPWWLPSTSTREERY